jgi:hypothetical protein
MAHIKKFTNFVQENIDHDAQHQTENYMFFGNLETIKRLCETLLEMDPIAVDNILKSGHSWAVDHIATSKDDIEEVFNFVKNEIDEPAEDEKDSARYKMPEYSEEELDQMTKDQMEHDEMMKLTESDLTKNVKRIIKEQSQPSSPTYISMGTKFCFFGSCRVDIKVINQTTSEIVTSKGAEGKDSAQLYPQVIKLVQDDLNSKKITGVVLPTFEQLKDTSPKQ